MLQLSEQEFIILPFHELRIITPANPTQRVRVTLQPNSDVEEITSDEMTLINSTRNNNYNNTNVIPHAEIFGSELTPGIPVQLPLCRSISVFSITGATVRVSASQSVLQKMYLTSNSNNNNNVWMRSLLDVHYHLQVKRIQEEQSKQKTYKQTKKEIVESDDNKIFSSKRIKTELESDKNAECQQEQQLNYNSVSEITVNKTISYNIDFDDNNDNEEDNIICGPRVLIVSDEPHVGCSTYVKWLAQLTLRQRKINKYNKETPVEEEQIHSKKRSHLTLLHSSSSSATATESYYHTLILETNECNPSLGYPCCLSLYELQHSLDVEEEATFVPALHACIGTSTSTSYRDNNEENGTNGGGGGTDEQQHEQEAKLSLHFHAFRSLMQAAIEKMARCGKCRRGGMFIDYGVIDPREVLLAEEAEIQVYEEQEQEDLMEETENEKDREESMNKRISTNKQRHKRSENTRTNPLDNLLDVMEEAEIDHVMVVQSAWLRFKIAQRAHRRYTTLLSSLQESRNNNEKKKINDKTSEPFGFTTPNRVILSPDLSFDLFLLDSVHVKPQFDRFTLHRQKWLNYFFGTSSSPVRPTLITVEVSSIRLVMFGSARKAALTTLMPMSDDEEEEDEERRREVEDEEKEGKSESDNVFHKLHKPNTKTRKSKIDPAAITFLTIDDVPLKRRVVGISTATEYQWVKRESNNDNKSYKREEELHDESISSKEMRRVPFDEFELNVKRCLIRSFALIESVNKDTMTLLVNGSGESKELGLCLILTDQFLLSDKQKSQ